MTFAHEYGTFNVQGSLNNWFVDNLTGAGIPSWMPSARIKFDHPEPPLLSGYSGHTFSVDHMPVELAASYQGRHVGKGEKGSTMQGGMAINCWVSREQAGNSYQQRLRQMGDMVSLLFQSGQSVLIGDYYEATASPATLTAIVRVQPARETIVPPDPNPDIVRRRFLAPYNWVERVTGA